MLIQANRAHHLLNSKSEYNCCALPRLGTKLGERETKEKREEVEEEERKEQELEERIRNLRKDRQRLRRNNRQPNQPRKKKQKMDTDKDIEVANLVQDMRRGEKRKEKQLDIQESMEHARLKKRRKVECARAEPPPPTPPQSNQSQSKATSSPTTGVLQVPEARAEHQDNLIENTDSTPP